MFQDLEFARGSLRLRFHPLGWREGSELSGDHCSLRCDAMLARLHAFLRPLNASSAPQVGL